MKLVEQCTGVGELSHRDRVFADVSYRIDRFQGMARSGLPIPGVLRIEGSVDVNSVPEDLKRVGTTFSLKLDDGRVLRVTLADGNGRVLTEGHGPTRCTCC